MTRNYSILKSEPSISNRKEITLNIIVSLDSVVHNLLVLEAFLKN